jgi:hypothetical protein
MITTNTIGVIGQPEPGCGTASNIRRLFQEAHTELTEIIEIKRKFIIAFFALCPQ